MAIKAYSLALTAAAQPLSNAFANADKTSKSPEDLPFRQLIIRAAGADAQLWDSSSFSTGINVNSTTKEPITLGPFQDGPIKLSQLQALGASATLYILGITY